MIWLPVAAILIGMAASGNGAAKRARRIFACAAFSLAIMVLISCAGVSNGGGGGGPPPPPVTYHITVSGTSPGTANDAGQSTTVTLVVN